MMRKLAIALSLVSAMGTGTANALGLGEATVHSSLNQPLNAEIELVNIRDLEKSEILPALASREEFAKANVDRLYFLSDIRFEVTRNKQGNTVVKLSTRKPVREPYLNFLVEVIWPSGRLLREYALLIDPPLFSQSTAALSGGGISPTASALPDIEVMDESDALLQEQTSIATSTPPSRVTRPIRAKSTRVTKVAANSYGPTRKSETLWAIALKVRPDRSYSPQQTMLAIQDLNPNAFVNGNINILKSGQILRLPDAEEISVRTRSQAIQEVMLQNRALKEGSSLASRQVDSTLRPVADSTPAVPESDGSELKIVVAQAEQVETAQSGAHAGTSRVGGGQAIKEQLTVTLEKLDKAKVENEELSSRVKDLEDQLQTLQQLLTLKDNELANIQNQFGQVADTIDQPTADDLVESGRESTDVGPPVGEVDDAMPETVDTADADTTGMVTEDTVNKPGSESMTPVTETMLAGEAEQSASSADTETLANETKPIPKQVTPKSEPVPEQTGLIDTLMDSPFYLGGGVAGALALILGLIGLSKRNARKEKELHENLAADVDTDIDEQIDLGLANANAKQESANKQNSEVGDPVSEADVYIAYGRLDQAAVVLESAVSDEPGRSDIRLKLLEVYKESGENEAFFRQYKEIEALDDDVAIAKANELSAGMELRHEDSEPDISIDDLENELLSSGADFASDFDTDTDTDTATSVDRVLAEDDELDFELNESDLASAENELDGLGAELDLDTELSLDAEKEFDTLDTAIPMDDLESDISKEEMSHDVPAENDDEALLDEDLISLSGLDDTPSEDELESLDANFVQDQDVSVDLESVKHELEDVSSVLADGTQGNSPSVSDLDDIDDLDIDSDLSLEDLDAELDAEMDIVNETIDHEEGLDGSGNETPAAEDELVLGEVPDLDELSDDDGFEDIEVAEVLADDFGLDGVDDSEETRLEADLEAVRDLDGLEDEDQVALADEATTDFDYLSGTDEAATKLDLARAYIDMGDQDGAKDILEEVAIEGNDDQKFEARKLMKGLD
ncbi:MAG: hypothetical protein CSA50_01160 [Gammaproteobacteria bacterium]|nr:MAG: hypothetical protein CSA50_01160 [Gammaproteobacteria bacterium]